MNEEKNIQKALEDQRNKIIGIVKDVQSSFDSNNVFDVMFRKELQGIIDRINELDDGKKENK